MDPKCLKKSTPTWLKLDLLVIFLAVAKAVEQFQSPVEWQDLFRFQGGQVGVPNLVAKADVAYISVLVMSMTHKKKLIHGKIYVSTLSYTYEK